MQGEVMSNSMYRRLMTVLADSSVDYRVINHAAEGHTERASKLRGHALGSAAKCMIVSVRAKDAAGRYVLAVIPGDRKVDYRKIKRLYGGTDAVMADRAEAERLAACESGCIIPFSFEEHLSVVLDPMLLGQDQVYFNAARLDRSIGMSPSALVALAKPRIEPISK
ncbi:YbaK/prolyl-tRNA synthetase associated domain-containing protein [Streptomyces ramulosus]